MRVLVLLSAQERFRRTKFRVFTGKAMYGSSALNRLSLPKTLQSVSHQHAFN